MLGGELGASLQQGLESVRADYDAFAVLQQQGQLPTLLEELQSPLADGPAAPLRAFEGQKAPVQQRRARQQRREAELERKQFEVVAAAGLLPTCFPHASLMLPSLPLGFPHVPLEPSPTPSPSCWVPPLHPLFIPSSSPLRPLFIPSSIHPLPALTSPHPASRSAFLTTLLAGERASKDLTDSVVFGVLPPAKAVGKMAARRVAQAVAGGTGRSASKEGALGVVAEMAAGIAQEYADDLDRGARLGPLAGMAEAVAGPTKKLGDDLRQAGAALLKDLSDTQQAIAQESAAEKRQKVADLRVSLDSTVRPSMCMAGDGGRWREMAGDGGR